MRRHGGGGTSRFASTNDSVMMAMMMVARSHVERKVKASIKMIDVTGSASYQPEGSHTAERPNITM